MAAASTPAPVIAVCGLAFEAAIVAGSQVAVVCGPGARSLATPLAAALGNPPAVVLGKPPAAAPGDPLADLLAGGAGWAGILSFGCAGALDPGLAPGTCVLATGVQTAHGFVGADAAWLHALRRCLPDAVAGELAGLDAPLLTAADKARLGRATGACAVDMESHAAALAARRYGVPFAACRVVLDPAGRSVPSCALAGMRPDGTVAPWALLRALAAAPADANALCALARDALAARRGLRRVRTRLGPALASPYCVCPAGAATSDAPAVPPVPLP